MSYASCLAHHEVIILIKRVFSHALSVNGQGAVGRLYLVVMIVQLYGTSVGGKR